MIAVELQVLGAALRAIAEEMGAVLIRSAFSANIKERRDCSTALFDEHGHMVTQAEHIPVHLVAMPEAVAAVRAHDPAPAEPWILNDPYAGGTHLPDLTTVTKTALGYAVTRDESTSVRSTASPSGCRRWRCTRSAPAEGRSSGSTREARFASDPRARARILAQPATDEGASGRR